MSLACATLPREARRLINQEAHRRAKFAPPELYRRVFERERACLAAQYSVVLEAGFAVDEADQLTRNRRIALIEEAKRRIRDAA